METKGICAHINCDRPQKQDSLFCVHHTCPICLRDKSSQFPYCVKHINQQLRQDAPPPQQQQQQQQHQHQQIQAQPQPRPQPPQQPLQPKPQPQQQRGGLFSQFFDHRQQPLQLRRLGDEIRNLERLHANRIITERERKRNLENYKLQCDTLFAWSPVPTSTASIPGACKLPLYNRDYEKVIKYSYNLITKKWSSFLAIVKIQDTPFSEGSLRGAYYMTDYTKPDGENIYVAKLSKSEEQTSIYFADVQMQCICTHLAKQYNKAGVPKQVKFVDAFIIERIERPDKQVMGCERYLPGKYTKYNNNNGYVSPEARNTPQAFSHFTYCFTQRNLIVTDIQGVDDMYTDPQVHSLSGGFGLGNTGIIGIQRFIASHHCNRICIMLGLSDTLGVEGGTLPPYKLGELTPTTVPSESDLKYLNITKETYDYLAAAFVDADQDKNGMLSVVEISKICNKLLNKDASQLSHHLLHLIDTDHNGAITFKEFLMWWTGIDDQF